MNIHFFQEDINYTLSQPTMAVISEWLVAVAKQENTSIESLNYIFCSDSYLHEINKTHLAHDYFTDVITFDFGDSSQHIIGDAYISIDRVQDNAQRLGVPFQEELLRVIVHGLLHLLGYQDKKPTDKQQMTQQENLALALLTKLNTTEDFEIVEYT